MKGNALNGPSKYKFVQLYQDTNLNLAFSVTHLSWKLAGKYTLFFHTGQYLEVPIKVNSSIDILLLLPFLPVIISFFAIVMSCFLFSLLIS